MTVTRLCFHGIGECRREREPGESMYWMSHDTFVRTLDLVVDRPHVRLSFDDGNRSDVDAALPALIERGLSADFFVLAGRLDDADSLGADDLRTLVLEGMRIGSHGWDHVPWRRLDEAAQRREFDDARVLIAETAGRAVDSAAFPLGRYDASTLRGLRGRGYRRVFSSDRFPAREGSWLQARYSVTAHDTVESVRGILDRSPGPGEARNLAASLVKRLR